MRNSKIVFFVKCRNDVIKTHYLPILDSDSLQASYAKENIVNSLVFRTNVLLEAMNNFQATEEDVTVDVRSECLFLRNYEEWSIKNKILKTELKMTSNEFEEYRIDYDTVISFSMKEFRAILNFAEFLDLPVKFNFETTGVPVIFTISNDSTFEANFVMATSEPDNEDDISSRAQTSERNESNFSAASKTKRKDKNNVGSSGDVLFNFQNKVSQNSCPQYDQVQFTESLPNFSEQISSEIRDDSLPVNDELVKSNVIPASPQCDKYDKIIKKVFKRCFEATYNPSNDRPNENEILAEDSDVE